MTNVKAQIKKLNSFEEFNDFLTEVNESGCKLFLNGKRINKRKLQLSNVEDMFDNGFIFNYFFLQGSCYLTIEELGL